MSRLPSLSKTYSYVGTSGQEELEDCRCTVYTVQCTVYSVQCTVYSVQYTVYRVAMLYTRHQSPQEA